MKENLREFDSITVPLTGMNLVEAAAGTGKTYNIQNIVVRLLWEKNLDISQIAVLSFTKEAASELAERIRRVFDRIIAVLEKRKIEKASEAEQAEALVRHDRKLRPEVDDKKRIAVIKDALRDFDSANISTINGFCQKLLQRFAFESGTTFSASLETRPEPVIRAIFDDWMRGKLYGDDKSLIYKGLIKPDEIYALEKFVQDHNLENPEYDSRPFFAAVAQLRATYDPETVFSMFNSDYFAKKSKVLSRKETFLRALDSDDFSKIFELIEEVYHPLSIREKAKEESKIKIAVLVDSHPFFVACGKIARHLKTATAALKREALVYASAKFAELAKNSNFMTFSDQIHIVDEALKNSEAFKISLREKFKAGIIDEFQDTDPAQYRIFKALFDVEGGCAFMVGDPRQAIYRFRGGDINAYLAVKEELKREGKIYRLGRNYRSSVNMVNSVNRIFAIHPDPFCHRDITFPNLASRDYSDAPELRVDGKPAAEALVRYKILEEHDDWADVCARRISYLISSGRFAKPPRETGKEPDPVVPGDIIVLLRSNQNCIKMRQELEKYNIPAACLKSGNVYGGIEAAELCTILDAVVNFGYERKVHTALATGLCNVQLSELEYGADGSATMNSYQNIFCQLLKKWQTKGFVPMFEDLLQKFNICETLAEQLDGERRLTNLFQLEELLLQQSVSENLSPERLVSQFSALIAASEENKDEEHEELMSSDSSCVRIMTIHSSKGLQSPIVIIPGIRQFDMSKKKLNGFCSSGGVRTLNFSGNEEMNNLEREELYAEMRRLIYVAVTRAEYRCEIFEEKNVSKTVWNDLADKTYYPEMNSCEGLSEDVYPWDILDLKDSVPEVKNIAPAWRVISYSELTSNVNSDLESVQDHDESGETDQDDKINKSVFSPYTISGGTGFGNIMHSYLENADFNSSIDDCRKAAASLIEQIKIPDIENIDEFTSAFGKWICDIFNTPIADWQGGSFCLSDIPQRDRLMELEFCCSLDGFSTTGISNVLEEYTRAEFGHINYPDNWEQIFPGGILNGFIDMVFRRDGKYYIVDWKTNRLGCRQEDYRPEKLGNAMVHSMYFVQYLLYMVALVRHLRRYCNGVFGEAEYEQMIGGVYYFFVRGMSPSAPECGVFRSRPPWKTVCELEEMLCLKM